MVEKIRIELEDGTQPGLNSIDQGLEELSRDADKLEQNLDEAAAAQDKLTDGGKNIKSKMSMPLTELNQGLQLLKQGVQLAARALTTLAADGNPAFVKLEESVTGVQNALLDMANDPEIQNFITQLADSIQNDVIPAIGQLPDAWRNAQDSAADFFARTGERIGLFAEGTVESLKQIQEEEKKSLELAKEAAELAKQRAQVDDKLNAIGKQIADQEQLMALARIDNETTVRTLLEEETESLRELAKEGRATREEQEAAYKRITVLQKRLVEIPKEEAEAAIRGQEQASQEREEATQKAAADAAKLADKVAQETQRELDAVIKAEEEKRQERQRSLDALTKQISPQIEEARKSISDRQLAEQIASQREDKVFAAGGSKRDQRQARIDAFADVRFGRVGQEERAGAENQLLNSAVQQAQATGRLGQEATQAFAQVANNQQQAAQIAEQQTQEIAAIRRALSGVGNSLQSSAQRSRAQRGGLGP